MKNKIKSITLITILSAIFLSSCNSSESPVIENKYSLSEETAAENTIANGLNNDEVYHPKKYQEAEEETVVPMEYSIDITSDSLPKLNPGDTLNLSDKERCCENWRSSNPYVASVDEFGKVSVLRRGASEISCISDGKSLNMVIDTFTEDERKIANDASDKYTANARYLKISSGYGIVDLDHPDRIDEKGDLIFDFIYFDDMKSSEKSVYLPGEYYNGYEITDCSTAIAKKRNYIERNLTVSVNYVTEERMSFSYSYNNDDENDKIFYMKFNSRKGGLPCISKNTDSIKLIFEDKELKDKLTQLYDNADNADERSADIGIDEYTCRVFYDSEKDYYYLQQTGNVVLVEQDMSKTLYDIDGNDEGCDIYFDEKYVLHWEPYKNAINYEISVQNVSYSDFQDRYYYETTVDIDEGFDFKKLFGDEKLILDDYIILVSAITDKGSYSIGSINFNNEDMYKERIDGKWDTYKINDMLYEEYFEANSDYYAEYDMYDPYSIYSFLSIDMDSMAVVEDFPAYEYVYLIDLYMPYHSKKIYINNTKLVGREDNRVVFEENNISLSEEEKENSGYYIYDFAEDRLHLYSENSHIEFIRMD